MAENYLIVPRLSRAELRRFFSKVTVDHDSGCWLWQGARLKRGYGQAWFDGRRELAHRLMFAWLVNPIPKGIGSDIPNLDHVVCDTPSCCNPCHVDLVSPKQNVLRGDSISAINASKTHCERGHLLPTGTAIYGRRCRICTNAWHRAYYIVNRKKIIAKVMEYERRKRAV